METAVGPSTAKWIPAFQGVPKRHFGAQKARHSRESGNPGVLEGGYAVFPRSTPPGFPLSRE